MRYTLENSIHIAAAPEDVYALVSDVTRTGEWSPQCRRVEWESDDRGVGARFTGHNSKPGRDWTTHSSVTVAEEGREFAWRLDGAGVEWGYRLTPMGGGTLLTEYTNFPLSAEQFFQAKFGETAEAEMKTRLSDAVEGIEKTLQTIKSVMEKDTAAR